jgi:RHS repeat-associated protein
MNRSFAFFLFVFIIITPLLYAQETERTPLIYDTSGYQNFSAFGAFSVPNDTIPAIKSEMNVTETGALTYTIPIEILKGVNNFQPNLVLSYNSQAGNGMAGWGWNIMGLSTINIGGRSKLIDGITKGPQFNDQDPFYLDGERLIKISAAEYVTEKFSKIKITTGTSAGYTFTVQYTDGKIAKYKELIPGQHFISVLMDAMGNEIHYDYTILYGVATINTISYSGTSVATDKFKISFTYKNRAVNNGFYRNGYISKGSKVLSEVIVSSSYIAANNGLYRKYTLIHDLIQSGTTERLTEVRVLNENGETLRPLKFGYNTSSQGTIEKNWGGILQLALVRELGNVTVGDFHAIGKPYAVYEMKDHNNKLKLWSPKTGTIEAYDKARQLFSGKTLVNGKISENDVVVSVNTDYLDAGYIDRLDFKTHDLVSYFSKTITLNLPAVTVQNTLIFPPFNIYIDMGSEEENKQTTSPTSRDRRNRKIVSGDLNNDGLVDLLVFQPGGTNITQRVYFLEIGKTPGGVQTPTLISCPNLGTKYNVYQIEHDGDGIPELLVVSDNGDFKLLKFFQEGNALQQIPMAQGTASVLSNFTDKTPLIFGDFNGDGLTDFITPQKIYSIEGSSSAAELSKMDSEQLLWWEYISTGLGFIKTQKNYTSQKLAYIAPSQRNVIKRSSDWQKFWSGKPDVYQYTEYGSSNVIPVDINNDGKTDLVSFKKFGRAKYQDVLWSTDFQDDNSLTSPTANKIFFHITKTLANGDRQLVNSSSTLSLQNTRISPLSLIINATDYNQLNTYKNELIIHDPLIRQDTKIVINNDEFIESQLRSVNNGGPIIQKIEYRPMAEKNNTDIEQVYTTRNLNLPYPYFINKNIGINYLTYKVHTEFSGKILTKEYRYQNGIQHLEGKGFMGFEKTFSSDTYESELINGKYRMKNLFEGVYWKINTYNPYFENALSSVTYGSLNPNSIFNRTVYTNQIFTKSNNRYLILPVTERATDYLKDVTVTKNNIYDTAGDLLLKQINTVYGTIGSTVQKFYYKPEFTNGQHYFFGKLEKAENQSSKEGTVLSSKEEFTYNTNGTVLQNKKYGNATDAITKDYTYFPFGAIKTETLNTTGLTSSMVTSYQYDTTNRYVWKVTSPDGLVTVTNVNPLGQLTSEISGLGLSTSYKYDNWGNIKEIKNFLGKKTTIRQKVSELDIEGTYSISKKTEGGAETIVTLDKFDAKIETKTKTLNNQWVIVKTEYDIYGRIVRTSEPFFNGDPIQWNTIVYDELDRPITHTSFNGKIATTCYEGLKVTVEDGHKKISKWVDAMGHTVKHQDEGGIIHYKYYPNGTLKETNYEGIVTKVEIDGWGNKKKVMDPSAGNYLYEYDNLSRLKKQTNPKGGVTQYVYDAIGRLESESTVSSSENTTISINYSYDPTTKLPTLVSGTYNGKNYSYATYYDDPYKRITGKKETTPDFSYESKITYDDFGRISITELKTILSNPNHTSISQVKNIYDTNGILIRQLDNQTSNLIWQVNSVTPKGLPSQMQYGNGYTLNNTYNTATHLLERTKHFNQTATVLDIQYNYDPVKGILLNRNNLVFNKNESYEYDNLNRLLKETVNGVVDKEYTYDKRGRMTSNSDVGKYNYNEQNYKLQKIDFNQEGVDLKTNRGFVQIQYNAFKSPNEIYLEGKDRITYEHSILKTRSASYYGSLSTTATQRPNRKFYSADKAIEIVTEGNITKVITYITGDPYTANYIKIDLLTGGGLTSTKNYFLHRDTQGTILAITQSGTSGTVIEQRYFDAWGNLKGALVSATPKTPNNLGWVPELIIDRGYTGHEHLKTVGLIHMNGRIYDPELRRFMSPDNYVQDPYNTQNYNRYSYVLNNPLLYTDPGGEEITLGIAILIAAAVAILSNSVANIINNVPFWYGMGKAATMGAISGAISFGIGAVQSAIYSTAQAAAMTLKDAALAGLGSIIGNFIPSIDIKMGDWSVSLNVAIILGSSNGLGLNLQVSYTAGDWNFSGGFGLVNYAKYNDTGVTGMQRRYSAMITYDDGQYGFGLGTNFWRGSGGMKTFEQQTGVLKLHAGDFKAIYENDGLPFGFKGKKWNPHIGDGNDSFRTAAATISIGDFSAGFNLFTGERNDYDGDEAEMAKGAQQGRFGETMPYGFVKENGTPYRLGAAYLSYKGLRVGINSDRYVRHPIQDIGAHKMISKQPGFISYSDDILPYFQYQADNPFTTW